MNNSKLQKSQHSQPEFQKLVDAIHSVQQNEKYLYNRVSQINSAPVYDNQEKNNVVEQIRKLQTTRSTLYDSLISMYKQKTSAIQNDNFEIENGVKMINIINDELQYMKSKIDTEEMNQEYKKRTTEVENYEQKRYRFILNLLKIFVYMVIAVIVIMVAHKLILPDPIAVFLYIIALSIGSISIVFRIYDMSIRNNLYFDKYDWNINDNYEEGKYVPIETDNVITSTSKKNKCIP